ncbi:hypothetical protein GV827_17565 [Sulfitobacter sp. JBTF-M27]|uniref:Uncharacterized protein n=1 Tax=Sulfitobacter sediminilitoris TaxID=2698830 RepID=A0A6P0CE77_9RHOB|nr:hypothetical protein [Sulfitobacter sediminilitoris]NEK24197.1 hypothetical protein [Sulfitobacter sediminilitoris]
MTFLVMLCFAIGLALIGLGFMAYQAKNMIAPVLAAIGLVLIWMGSTGAPLDVFHDSEEREFRAKMRSFDPIEDHRIGFAYVGADYPDPFNRAGEPNFWFIMHPKREIHARAEQQFWDCERRFKKEVAGYTICDHEKGMIILGTRIVLDHFNRVSNWCEPGCKTIAGKIQRNGTLKNEPVVWDFPPEAMRDCWGVRALTDNLIVEIRYNGKWRVFDEATAPHLGNKNWVEITGMHVSNYHPLPGLYVLDRQRKPYLHNNSRDRAWLCWA